MSLLRLRSTRLGVAFVSALAWAQVTLAAGPDGRPATAFAAPGAIEGVVTGPDGKPVGGALVAAVSEATGMDEPQSRAKAMATSDDRGRYRLAPLPPGGFAVTATAPGHAAAFRGELTVAASHTLQGIDLAFPAGGATFSGTITDRAGKPLGSGQVRAFRYSDLSGDVFYAKADAQGRYTITLPAAQYLLLALAEGSDLESRQVEADHDRPLDFHLAKAFPPGPAPPEVVSWIRAHEIPLATTEPTHDLSDLQPVEPLIGQAHLVALGEATHGSREFFQLKHRLLELLVTKLGFTVFGIEATMPEGFDIDEYVQTGRGDPAKALAALYFWTWNTEEVLDLIRWMRTWNLDPGHAKKVHFYGFDMQSTPRAAKVTLDYLERVDPEAAARLAGPLAFLRSPLRANDFSLLPADRQRVSAAAVADLADQLDRKREAYTARTSAAAWELARQHARILAQFVEMSAAGDVAGSAVRDRSMAENIRWILNREGPGTRMVVWAHNGHVAAASGSGEIRMGSYLRQSLGADMVVLGFAFDQGSFQAVGMPPGPPGLQPFTVGPAPAGSLDATLAAAGRPFAVLDLRRLPAAGTVTDWFAGHHATRSIGAGFAVARDSAFLQPMIAPDWFDGLIFVERTTAARPLQVEPYLAPQKLAQPANLDLEGGEIGGVPSEWRAPSRQLAFDYNVALTQDRPHQGSRCALLERTPGPHYGETLGVLAQRLDAAPWRGKRIHFRAWSRAEALGKGSEGHLTLRVAKKGFGTASSSAIDPATDPPITAGEWRAYELAVDVPPDADAIAFGIALVGDGRLWLDDVSLAAE